MIEKKIKNKVTYKLTKDECKKLISAGNDALKFTFPKANEGFAVALMTERGNIYTGASYKSDTATLTMHSEAVALAHAANHGETKIVAITGPNCHICKQLIYESSLRSKK
jgi:cytidine deaminase